MPSVEMRRSTRVFVPKAKDGEFVRVLRSGRRLWVDSSEVKNRETKSGDDWYPLINDNGGVQCNRHHKINGWHNVGPTNDNDDGVGGDDPMDVDDDDDDDKFVQSGGVTASLRDESSDDRGRKMMFKNVYSRKRKRLNVRDVEVDDRKKFGLHFVRRQRRRHGQVENKFSGDEIDDHGVFMVVVETNCVGFSSIMSLILRYVSRNTIGFAELLEFLHSRPISPVFASSGIQFLWNRPPIKNKGLCRIYGVRQLITMFKVDYMAAPHCFLHLHATMFFRSMRLSCLSWTNFDRKNESIDEHLPCIIEQSDNSLGKLVAVPTIESKVVKSLNSSPGKLSSRNVQSRVGVLTRSASKRRRRTLRSRRARNPLHFALQKSSVSPVSSHVSLKKNGPTLPIAPKQEFRRSVRKSIVNENNVQDSTSQLGVNVDTDSQCCFANVLVIEADKCYRVERAEVVLDFSSTNECHLAVKKDGLTGYQFKAQREFRPGTTTNRYNHAVIWNGDNGWKLEFPERKDWTLFKELYKVCGEKNIVPTSPVVKIIPVPKVCEVTDLWESHGAFKRPDSYIRTTGDEVDRALSRKTANYDMDYEDEEWLNSFNSELEDASNHVSIESFELMIDAFEKASHRSPDDVNVEKFATSLPVDLASAEVAEPVCRYWMKKRKQKCAPLNRVFQLNQQTREPMIKPVLRKKRSLKRQLQQQRGRGKDSNVLQVIAAEHNAAEEQSSVLRAQDAKASADKAVEMAIHKRQRAQFLMENADLAMYRATMALRIADAAGESLDHGKAADNFLDLKEP